MTHVDTTKEPRIGAVAEYDFIAIFQCSRVRSHRKREAFELSAF